MHSELVYNIWFHSEQLNSVMHATTNLTAWLLVINGMGMQSVYNYLYLLINIICKIQLGMKSVYINLHEYLHLMMGSLLGYNLILFVLPVKMASAPPHVLLPVITKHLPYFSG